MVTKTSKFGCCLHAVVAYLLRGSLRKIYLAPVFACVKPKEVSLSDHVQNLYLTPVSDAQFHNFSNFVCAIIRYASHT